MPSKKTLLNLTKERLHFRQHCWHNILLSDQNKVDCLGGMHIYGEKLD